MGAESGPTVHSLAVEYIRKKYGKPGKVFLGIVSRLDTVTSGVLVLARTSKAASRLTPQFGALSQAKKQTAAKNAVARADKIYLAVVDGKVMPDLGKLSDYVLKDDSARRMRVVSNGVADAKLAELDYITIGHKADATLLAVRLRTGRKHQIRVQFSDRGHCLLGDRKYDSPRTFGKGIDIALHSWLLQIDHPTKKQRMNFVAPVPPAWKPFEKLLPSETQLRETIAEAFAIEV